MTSCNQVDFNRDVGTEGGGGGGAQGLCGYGLPNVQRRQVSTSLFIALTCNKPVVVLAVYTIYLSLVKELRCNGYNIDRFTEIILCFCRACLIENNYISLKL
jgi:hypothetical protein